MLRLTNAVALPIWHATEWRRLIREMLSEAPDTLKALRNIHRDIRR